MDIFQLTIYSHTLYNNNCLTCVLTSIPERGAFSCSTLSLCSVCNVFPLSPSLNILFYCSPKPLIQSLSLSPVVPQVSVPCISRPCAPLLLSSLHTAPPCFTACLIRGRKSETDRHRWGEGGAEG